MFSNDLYSPDISPQCTHPIVTILHTTDFIHHNDCDRRLRCCCLVHARPRVVFSSFSRRGNIGLYVAGSISISDKALPRQLAANPMIAAKRAQTTTSATKSKTESTMSTLFFDNVLTITDFVFFAVVVVGRPTGRIVRV